MAATLTGRVTEAGTGTPIPGADIYFPELHTGTTTDAEGRYSIGSLPAMPVMVRVSMVGYTTVVRTIDLSQTAAVDFVLVPSMMEMEAVVVTGASRATKQRHQPVPMALANRDFLRTHSPFNTISALARLPGIEEVGSGPSISKPYIRGLGGNRVLTLFNGVRQEDQQWGAEHGVEIDPFLIDRVEVTKGPASLIHGSDALAGVVNLLPAPPVAPGVLKGSALAGYHTNNNGLASSLAMDGNNSHLVYGMRLSGQLASNYRSPPDGRTFGTKYAQRDLNGYVGVNRSWGFARLRLGAHNKLVEIPDGARDSLSRRFIRPLDDEGEQWEVVGPGDLSSYRIGTVHQHIQRYHAQLKGGIHFGKGLIRLDLGVQRSDRKEYEYPEHPGTAALSLLLDTYTYGVKHNLPEVRGWTLTWGVDGMVQVNDATRGTEFLIPNYRSMDMGAFAHGSKPFGHVDLSGGIRYDLRRFRSEALHTQEDPTTGFEMVVPAGAPDSEQAFAALGTDLGGIGASLGMAWHTSEHLTLKANVGRGYRAPDAVELTANGIHSGEGLVQVGNPVLKPETNVQGDLGAFYVLPWATASVELFANRVDRYIFNGKIPSTTGGDSLQTSGGLDLPVFQYRQTAARLLGGEASVDIHPVAGLHIGGSLAYVSAINLGAPGITIGDDAKYLPLIPPLSGAADVRYSFAKPLGPVSKAFVRLGVQVHAAQRHFYAAYGTETGTPGYHTLDAALGGELTNGRGRTVLRVTVLGTNLANTTYQSHLSRLKYFDNHPERASGRSGLFAMGRNISFMVEVPFNLKSTSNPPSGPAPGGTPGHSSRINR